MEARLLSQWQMHMLTKSQKKSTQIPSSSAGQKNRGSCEERDGVSYLNDDVPIRCLYVTGMGAIKGLNWEAVLKHHFEEEDGEVETIVVCSHKTDPKKHFAFVMLKDYIKANLALAKVKRVIKWKHRNLFVYVKAADSWHQPKSTIPRVVSTHVYNPNKSSIDDLNDDCLLTIFDWFSVVELVQICGVSDRWDDLLEMIARTKFSEFHLDQVMPLKTLCKSTMPSTMARKLIKFVGPAVKILGADGSDFKEGHREILHAIADHCTQLETLKLDAFELNGNSNYVKEIFKRLKVFRTVSEHSFSDENIKDSFEVAENLRQVTIDGNKAIMGTALSKLKDLTKLKLNNCLHIQPIPLYEALKCWGSTLKCLSLKQCNNIDNAVIITIVNELKVLEKLTISNQYERVTNLPELAKCKQLKTLKIVFRNLSSVDPLLQTFAASNHLERLVYFGAADFRNKTIDYVSQMTKLTKLDMLFNSILNDQDLMQLQNLTSLESLAIPGANMVSKQSILGMVKACPKLRWLDVSQTTVDDEFVYAVLDIQKKEPERPAIMLVLFDTKVDEDLEESEVIKKNSDRIELDFLPHTLEPDQFDLGDDDDDDFSDDDDYDSDYDFDDELNPWDFDVNEQWGFFGSDDDKYMLGWGNVDSPDESDLDFI